MIEVRFNELRLKGVDSRIIEGTAIVFNSDSELLYGEFREIIKPSAITEDLIKKSDILMLYNHNDVNGVLARSRNGKGTLNITVDENGVHYSFKAPSTRLGDDMLEMIERGDINSSSFAFTVNEDGQRWEKKDDGTYFRTIETINSLHDFSIVTIPAYSETKVNRRGLDKLKEQENKELENQEDNESDDELLNDVIDGIIIIDDELKNETLKIDELEKKIDELEKIVEDKRKRK